MELSLISLEQVAIMFVMIMLGFILAKTKLVNPETKSQGLFHQIQKEVTFCGLLHGADA